ncbi:MAG: bile acid:sodium symporter family protein [Planctomycetaceae bacterium]|nr:bile acid:sodium symporter family protein [Planctomycetaceae bacterium]
MLQRFLIVWLLLSSLVAAVWPFPFDPFIATVPILGFIVALTMLCIGSLLPADEVRTVSRKWPLVAWGTFVQYTSMPFLAWAMASLFGLPEDLRFGLALAGCVPGAMASNVLTLAAKGNVSYSVGLTSLATLLSPLLVPVTLRLTLGESIAKEELIKAAIALSWQVVLPVILGFTLSQTVTSWRSLSKKFAGHMANLAILWIIAVVIALNRSRLLQANGLLIPALLGLNLLGYTAGWIGARLVNLPRGMRVALILEVGMQNAGVGASIAVGMFNGRPQIALPCAAYAFGCMLTGTALAQVFAHFAPPDETPAADQPDAVSDL